MTKTIALIAAGAVLVCAAAFMLLRDSKHPKAADQPRRILVTTSFYPLFFFAQGIGGDRAEVINITPAGAEPHDYEPTANDIALIESSSLLILNGGGLEAWGRNIKKNIDPQHTTVIVAAEGLISLLVNDEGKSASDPHVWLSPPLAEQMVGRITQGFIQVDGTAREYYRLNANVLKAKLQELDTAFKKGLAVCRTRTIITSHAAFGYLASAYGLKQISIAGLSPDAEPSPRQLMKIAKFATDNQVRFIFFESLASPKLSQTIAREIGAETLVLNPLEGLSNTDLAMGKNFLTEMQNNLTNLKRALQCT